MTIIQTVLITLILVIWLCISITILISIMQGIAFEKKREIREAEYHKKRIRDFKC